MWNAHWHEERVAGFEAHALAAYFRDELAFEDVEEFVLLVMQVQRRSGEGGMLAGRNDEDGEVAFGVEGANDRALGD